MAYIFAPNLPPSPTFFFPSEELGPSLLTFYSTEYPLHASDKYAEGAQQKFHLWSSALTDHGPQVDYKDGITRSQPCSKEVAGVHFG